MKIKIIPFNLKYKPIRKHYNDAGLDVYTQDDILLKENETKSIRLGFGLELPDGYAGFVFPRSGLSSHGLSTELPPVDSGYRGEIHALVTLNHSMKYYNGKIDLPIHYAQNNSYKIEAGTRIAQLVILPVIIPDLVEDLGQSRNDNGFSSTGLK